MVAVLVAAAVVVGAVVVGVVSVVVPAVVVAGVVVVVAGGGAVVTGAVVVAASVVVGAVVARAAVVGAVVVGSVVDAEPSTSPGSRSCSPSGGRSSARTVSCHSSAVVGQREVRARRPREAGTAATVTATSGSRLSARRWRNDLRRPLELVSASGGGERGAVGRPRRWVLRERRGSERCEVGGRIVRALR